MASMLCCGIWRRSRDDQTNPGSKAQPFTSTTPPDLWRQALDKLDKHTRQKLKIGDLEQKPLRQQVDELVDTAKKKQEECEAGSWKIPVGDRKIVLREQAASVVSVLTQIGDIAIPFAPSLASIPWAVIKGVMQIPVTASEQMCALLASTEKIVQIIYRGQVYELNHTKENTSKPAFGNLQSTLLKLYSATLELLANSSELFEKNTAMKTIHAILHPGKTPGLFKNIDDLETELSRDEQACQSEKVCTLLKQVDRKEQGEILEWISPISLYMDRQDTVSKARTANTCDWLLRHEKFREWQEASSSVILWLHGLPGTGKTYLTSKVIDHINSQLEVSNHDGFAYFYCDRTENVRRDPLSVLRSYVRQLSTTKRNSGRIRERLRELRDETRLYKSESSFDMWKEQLLESVNLYPKTTLVLDALDECEPKAREDLVEMIEDLLSKSERSLKIFISSRPDSHIRKRFDSLPNIDVGAKDNRIDIKKFLDEKVKNDDWSVSLLEEIKKTLLARSEGMFQWVFLQVTQILGPRGCVTEKAARDRLGKLPDGLKATYDEIYSNIKTLNKNDSVFADRAFMWVMCACTPLGSRELLSAIRLDSEPALVSSSEEINESQLLHLCQNLLVLDPQRKVWRFSHLSVMEYLEVNCSSLRRPHSYAAKVCLGLFIETFKEPKSGSIDSLDDKHDHGSKTCNIFDPKYPLSMYVRRHWRTHVQAQKKQDFDTVTDVQVQKDQDVDLLDGLLGTFRKILGPFGAFIEENRDEEYEEYVARVLRFRYPNLDYQSPELCQFLIDSFVYRYYRIRYERHRPSQEIERSESYSPATSSIKLPVTLTGPPRILRDPVGKLPQRNVETVETVETYSEQLTTPHTTDIFDFRQKFKPISKPLQSEAPTVSGVTFSESGVSLYPRPRRVPDRQPFATCPICLGLFNAETFEGVMWTKHVHQDLQPYVCISKDCSKDFQFFATRRAWGDHMRRIHSPFWIRYLYSEVNWGCPLDSCSSKSALYGSKDQLIEEHMLKAHVDINEAELRRIANNSGIPQLRLIEVCPLCGFNRWKPKYQTLDVKSGPSGKKPESRSTGKRVQFAGELGEGDNAAELKIGPSNPHPDPEEVMGHEQTMKCIAGHMKSLAIQFANTLFDSQGSGTCASREQNSNEANPGSSLNFTDPMDSSTSLGQDDPENPPSDIDDISGIPPTEADHWEQIFGRKTVLTYEPP